MSQNKTSLRVYGLIRSAAAAAVLPLIFIYIMIAKPDYTIMNALAHVVLPVANWAGNIVTWPARAITDLSRHIRDMGNLRAENEELRVRLDMALSQVATCDVAIAENKKLARELNVVTDGPRRTIVADVVHDASAFHHRTFFINRGARDGIASGMIAVSFDGYMIGIVDDVADDFARVRTLIDANTNIAVRVAGSEVYGFLRGNGSARPTIGFFSDPGFQATRGVKLVTSNISGILPDGIIVGEMLDDTDVSVKQPSHVSRIQILQFDNKNEYK